MASIEKRVRSGRAYYRARYRDPSGRQRNKTFRRKVDAEIGRASCRERVYSNV